MAYVREKVKVTCLTCGKEFEVFYSQYANGRRKFCSANCRLHGLHFWLIGKQKVDRAICKRCGKEFIPNSVNNIYCSRRCARPSSVIFIKFCESCGKSFETERENARFCSKGCTNHSLKGGKRKPEHWITIKCDYCGKEWQMTKGDASRSKHHFCTDNDYACLSAWRSEHIRGKDHPAYGKPPSPRAGRGIGGYREDLGHYVRSSWEANVARWLKNNGYNYQYEPKTFMFDGFTYTPDFYVPSTKKWIEVKGWWGGDDRKKVDAFIAAGYNLWIIDKDEYTRLGFDPNETR